MRVLLRIMRFFRLVLGLLCGVLPDSVLLAKVSEPSLEPVEIKNRVSGMYLAENRDFNMILGADVTPKGRIWVAWIGGGDSDAAYILGATSADSGLTWSKPSWVLDPHRYKEEKDGQIRRRALVGNIWTDPQGRVWLFYDQSLGLFDGRAGVWASLMKNPESKSPTWTKPTRLFDGALLNKPIIFGKNKWLAFSSIWYRHLIQPDVFAEGHKKLDPIRGINVHQSIDQGKTWERIGGISLPKDIWEFDEPSVVELKSGELWMLLRSKVGTLESFSSDGGKTWSQPVKSAIANPSARIFLCRLKSGNLLLVKYGAQLDSHNGRSTLTAFLSTNDGRRWDGGLVIDERNHVTYPDGFQDADGKIHIFYDFERNSSAEILTSVFSEQEILNKKFDEGNSRKRVLINKATRATQPR